MSATANGNTTTANTATPSGTAATAATSNTTAATTSTVAATGTTAAAAAPTFIQEISGSTLNANDGVKLFSTLLSNIHANSGGILFVDEAYHLTSSGSIIGGQGKQVRNSTDNSLHIVCMYTVVLLCT
jgi:hypothetical protein